MRRLLLLEIGTNDALVHWASPDARDAGLEPGRLISEIVESGEAGPILQALRRDRQGAVPGVHGPWGTGTWWLVPRARGRSLCTQEQPAPFETWLALVEETP